MLHRKKIPCGKDLLTSIVPVCDMRPTRAKNKDEIISARARIKTCATAPDWDKAVEEAESTGPSVNAGIEWYPKLSRPVELPGFKNMWVCTARRCGHAFGDKSFLRAHQLSENHGKWDGMESKSSTVSMVDCTRSGEVLFSSECVERKMRRLVKQTSGTEEPRIDDNSLVPCKVLHTGDDGKGFGLFAARDLREGEYIGHYTGEIRDVGYSDRFSGHYTFGLLQGLVIDGIAGGAFRFMNHCLERQNPTVRALVVNHHGECRVALYANMHVRKGQELLLRYADISDAQFFAMECGQD
jgi:hypothetical protein